jgi:magnesium transporter
MATEQETIELTERIEEALRGPDVNQAAEMLTSIHPADRADLYERLDSELQEAFLSLLSAEEMAELMEYLEDEVRESVTSRMPRLTLARVLDKSSHDVAVDVLRTLPPADTARVLSSMATAQEVTPLLGHADESAGGLMTLGYVALHPEMTVGQAMTFLRLRKPLADEAYYLYVLDAANRLQGVVNLRELIISDPETPIVEVMTRDAIAVEPETDQEEAARLIQKYRLRALPVVDEERVLRGIITADDAMEVASEEATEDMYRMAGLDVQESVFSPVSRALRRRVPWLLVNLMTAFLAALTVSAFEDTISKVAVLAAFMPIIAGHGGNTGTQATTLVVRGIALGEVRLQDASRIAAKEIAFGLVHGCLAGALTAGLALVLTGNVWLAGVVFGAMIGNIVVAGLAGGLIPLGLRAVKIDPALASAIWLTTFTDVMGFLLLLGMGTLLISQLT